MPNMVMPFFRTCLLTVTCICLFAFGQGRKEKKIVEYGSDSVTTISSGNARP